MKKYIEIPAEALENIENDKYVEGSLQKKRDRIIRQLENGWLKESATRIKFYNSVKKDLGFRLVNVAMHRDLKDAMSTLEVRDLISRV